MKKLFAMLAALVLLGTFAVSAAETWTCPACGREGNDGNFCPGCAEKKPGDDVVCLNCGAAYDINLAYDYCPKCGTHFDETSDGRFYPSLHTVVVFGHYEQDGNPDNGPEAIEWIVAEESGGELLLVSKYALDTVPYNTELTDVTWEQCSLRAWLNSDFLAEAFSDAEQQAILVSDISNGPGEGNSAYTTVGGNDTTDRVFLLSCRDVFDLEVLNEKDMMCAPTDYAIQNGAWLLDAYTEEGKATVTWWLRSPGHYQNNAAGVFSDGLLLNSSEVNDVEIAVRPAIRIDMEAGSFNAGAADNEFVVGP